MGSIHVHDSTFTNCSAFLFGGALYTDGEAMVMGSAFTNNAAPTGGAIYASGTIDVEGNSFSGNTASESGANLAGDADLTGCGNDGLTGSGPCPAVSSAMSMMVTAHSMAVFVLSLLATLVL